MGFDNVVSLIIGVFLGFLLGTFVTTIRNIEAKVEEVDEIIKTDHGIPHDDENGMFKLPSFVNIMAAVAVLITVFAALQAQRSYNKATEALDNQSEITVELQSTQNRLENVVGCTQSYLSKALVALNNRTEFSGSQAQANVDLQTSQAQLFAIITHEPPYSDARRKVAVKQYVSDLQHFIQISTNTKDRVDSNPYPTDDEFSACLDASST